MATRPLKAVDDEQASEFEFGHSEITLKGTEYRFVELGSKVYDECTDLATKEDGDIDTVLLLKIMLPKSLVSPKLNEKQLAEMPMSLRRALLQEVDRLHFPPLAPARPTEESA